MNTIEVSTQRQNIIQITIPSAITVAGGGGGTGAVDSVNGKTGVVVLVKSDLGLGNVDNTSDTNKPVSTATQTALSSKVDKVAGKGLSTEDYTTAEKNKLSGIAAGAEVNVNADWNSSSGDSQILNKPDLTSLHTHSNKSILDSITEAFTGALKTAYDSAVSWISTNGSNLTNHLSNTNNPHSVTKSQVGLGNVDNTSDANKPVSTAQQTALDSKVNSSSLSTVATSGSYNDLSNKPTIPTNLDSLTDVVITTPTTNQVLKYNGTSWVNGVDATGEGGASAVDSVNGQTGTVVLDADDISDSATTNKFVTTSDKTNLSNLSGINTGDQDLSGYATTTQLGDKVDKVTGKGLSTEDYTTTEKNKLAGVAVGAEVNVNADWNASSGDSQILNKPDLTSLHSHSNKTVLDYITEAFTTALKSAYDGAVAWISTNGTNLTNHLSNASNPHSVTKSQVGLGSVVNADTTTTANITDSTDKRFCTDAQKTVIGNTSGTNTGDQTSVTGNAGTATALETARTINGVSFNGTANITVPDIILTAAPGSDHTATGIKFSLIFAVAANFGDVGYIDSNGKFALGDADAIATASCIVMCVDASVNLDATGTVMMLGIARDDTWAWTVGGLIYLSTTGTTGNTLTQTAPSGTDDVTQILGVATHADRMIFNPQLVQVEHT